MEKRGVTHIEVILSFLLFISATGLAIYFFSPAYKTEIVSSSLSYTYDAILKNVSTDLETFYVTSPDRTPCGINSPPQGYKAVVNIPIAGRGIKVESEGGAGIVSKIQNNKICYQTSECIAIIYLSDQITSFSSSLSCDGRRDNVKDGVIASSLSENVISEKLFNEINKSYYENYDGLKTELNVPQGTDFSFILVLSDKTIEAQKEAPVGVNVYSEANRIKLLRENGKREFAELQVRVW